MAKTLGMKVTRKQASLIRKRQAPKPKAEKKGLLTNLQDSVTLYAKDKVEAAGELGKSMAKIGIAGGLMAGVGLVGGLPGIAVASAMGAAAGFFLPEDAKFNFMNGLGSAFTAGTAALMGATGPVGLLGGVILGAGVTLAGSFLTDQTQLG